MPEIGAVEVTRASPGLLAGIDETWPSLRPDDDVHHAWRWSEISAAMAETFVVRRVDDHPIGVWASKARNPLRLPAGIYYRLDYLEVHPSFRGAGHVAGLLMVGLVAKRALERGAQGIVLTPFNVPGLIAFYHRLGATEGAPAGWNYPPELVALTLGHEALVELESYVDALEEDA